MKMARIDITDSLIHFIKGSSLEESFDTLTKIIEEKRLLGSKNLIKGGFKCICFSEAPIECLENGLVNSGYYSKYSPFGIMVPKSWLFSKGGRPAIYQREDEFYKLCETQQWRHVTYEPDGYPPIDFSWEREWRIKKDVLHFSFNEASIIVPDKEWADKVRSHYNNQEWEVFQYKRFIGREAAQYREPFEWRIYTLW